MSLSSSNSNNSNNNDKTEMVKESAAGIIQKSFRGFKDRLKAREQAAFNISQLIEYSEEQDHLNLNKFFSRWIQLIKSNKNEDITKYINTLASAGPKIKVNSIQIEDDYKGPHLNDEFNQKDFTILLSSFKQNRILHTKYALVILDRAIEVLKTLPNINEISCLESQAVDIKVNVIGDLHGQFVDLFTIFEKFGYPSPSNVFVFNGDFVDRGPQQCEVYFTLLYAIVLFKDRKCLYLNRGNHEDYGCSVRFGFKEEIMNKYCLYSRAIMGKCAQTFALLPIASIITQENLTQPHNKILVVHGGISLNTDLDMLRQIDRSRYDCIDGTSGTSTSEAQQKDKEQLQDLLWSDPQNNKGCVFNKQRHIAKQFGPDTTEAILKKYGFVMLIRSHECKNEGYEFHHGNKVVTVFSASNYCGGINKGAICVLKPKKKLEVKQFVAPGYEDKSQKERVEIFEEKVIRNLKRLLYANRTALIKNFQKLDTDRSGYLSSQDWSNVLINVMTVDKVPWLKYRDRLVDTHQKTGSVRYMSSFENCDVVYTFSTENKDINDALARYKETLVSLFNIIDDNHSGSINLQEFANACKVIFHDQNESISDVAIKSMIEAMDTNKDGKIDLSEFEQAFVIYT